jgi:hypothetical protein
MTQPHDFAARLRDLRACPEAIAWVGDRDAETAWNECERGDWMLWLLGMLDVLRQDLVLAACACARLSLPLVPEGEDRPRLAIEAAEDWARGGETTLAQVRRAAAYAADAADAAAYAAYAAYAAFAANAADAAAYAAAAARAAAAAEAAAYADAADAAAYAVSSATRREFADIVRRRFPTITPHLEASHV